MWRRRSFRKLRGYSTWTSLFGVRRTTFFVLTLTLVSSRQQHVNMSVCLLLTRVTLRNDETFRLTPNGGFYVLYPHRMRKGLALSHQTVGDAYCQRSSNGLAPSEDSPFRFSSIMLAVGLPDQARQVLILKIPSVNRRRPFSRATS